MPDIHQFANTGVETEIPFLSSKQFSLVKRLSFQTGMAFAALVCLGLAFVWFFASFYLQYRERQDFISYVEVLNQSLSTPVEYFDLAEMEATVESYAKRLHFEKLSVLDRYNFEQVGLGPSSMQRPPEYSAPILSSQKVKIGQLIIWKTQHLNDSLGLQLFLAAGVCQMIVIAAFSSILMKYIYKKELVEPLEALSDAIHRDNMFSPFTKSSRIWSRLEFNALANAYEEVLSHAKGLLDDRNSLLDDLRRENSARKLRVRLIEKALSHSKMALSYKQFDGEEFEFIGGWAPPHTRALISALASNFEDLSKISSQHKIDIRNQFEDTRTKAQSFDAHFENGDIWHLRILMIDGCHLAIFASDETNSKQLENALHHKNKLESLGSVASGVAHDFNNILAIISTTFEYFKLAKLLDSEHAVIVENAVNRGVVIVKQLLQFVQVNKVTSEIFDVAQLCQSQASTFSSMLGPHYSIEIDSSRNIFVKGNADFFQTILLNLVINSRDALTKKTGKIHIHLRPTSKWEMQKKLLDTDQDHISIDVRDNSSGIPKHILGNIFDPFFTTKPVGSGTGLGLSMAYEYLTRIGGAIYVNKTSKSGTTITMILPRSGNSSDQASQNMLQVQSDKNLLKRILIIDDEVALANVIAMYFKKLGLQITTCNSVTSAIEAVEQQEFDAVISDMHMPDGTGIDVLEKIHSLNSNAQFLLMSGNFQFDDNKAQSFEDQFNRKISFIEKPFELDALKDALFKLNTQRQKIN